MSMGNTTNNFAPMLRGLCLVAVCALWAPAAFADPCPPNQPAGITNCVFTTEAAITDTTCGGNRGAASCTAGEFVVNPSVESNTIISCNNGEVLTGLDIVVGLSNNNADRYNIGFFVGQIGNDPAATTAGNICSAAVFPTTPAPWFNAGAPGAACGDYSSANSATTETLNDVTGITVTCVRDANNHLLVPFLLTYQQNNNAACTGAADVAPGNSAKCNKGNLPVTNVTVNPVADLSVVKTIESIDLGVVTFNLVISNAGPDPADLAAYSDTVVPLFTNVAASCGGETGGAACGSQPTVGAYDAMAGTLVSGTVGTLPSGGSVTLQITGDFTPGATDAFCNDGAIDTPAGTVDLDTSNNTSEVCSTLPVKLEKFEVK
jgi:hypothetical protein